MKNKRTRTRFAPSPTGFVHIGNLRTALYAYLLAKSKNGDFVLRVENTDQKRLVEGSLEKIIGALSWAGINPDEGVYIDKDGSVKEKGELGPYFQSKRLDLYQNHAKKLLDSGHAYHCFCSTERLQELRKNQQKNGQPPMYDKKCLSLSKQEVKQKVDAGEKYVLRMNVPTDKIIKFEDQVYGEISVKSSTIDDQVIIKSDGFPTYHLAVVVDDHHMKISHIVRGEEWLPSTPKHVLLYEFFSWSPPAFVHVPNVLGENKKKLSKRQGDIGVYDFIESGYLPEALVNFISLLGWNPKNGQEHFTLKELEKIFDEKGLHKAGAVFDYKKLGWMNAHYIKQKNDDELLQLCLPFFEKYLAKKNVDHTESLLKKIVNIEKDRIKTINEITQNIDFYFTSPIPEKEMLRWKEMTDQELKRSLLKSEEVISSIEEKQFDIENLHQQLFDAAKDKKGELLWPLRVSLSGQKNSPSPFEIAWAIGKDEALKRIDSALKIING
ncbi:MAG: glutamate--tRNA ligase [Patescibacteria group bacterium]|nr:glutamate--tRNA ligase [Patescibacteria group bacterium]